MTDRYALIDEDGRVRNTVLWDGEAEWEPPEGLSPVTAPPEVEEGWRLEGGQWTLEAA